MRQYHKIQTVYFRDPENRNKTLLEGVWAKPEFELLKDVDWVWTEKIDGTNIRIIWDGNQIFFRGKTDNAQIPSNLVNVLREKFTKDKIKEVFPKLPNGEVACLYGEGYGAKIQKGGNYIPDGNDFILFDTKIEDWWLSRESNEDIAKKLGIEIVPIIAIGTLEGAIEYVRKGYKSTIADNKDYMAEGLILKPKVELFNRKGERVISKIKYKDFNRN